MKNLSEVEKSLHEIVANTHPDLRESLEFILRHLMDRKRHRETTNVPQLYFKLKAQDEPNLPPLWHFKEVFSLLAEVGVGKLDETARDMRFMFLYEVQSVGACGLGKGHLKLTPNQASDENTQPEEELSPMALVHRTLSVEVPLKNDRKAKLTLPLDLTNSEWKKIYQIASKARESRIKN